MALAYSTATVAAPASQGVFDALVAFMDANGWDVHDTLIANNDVVMTSTGTSGKLKLFIRLTRSSSAGNSYLSLADPHKAIDNIIVTGYSYWNASTHTGVGVYGTWGPWVWVTKASSTGDHSVGRVSDTALPNSSTRIANWDGNNVCPFFFDSYRKLYGFTYAANAPLYSIDSAFPQYTAIIQNAAGNVNENHPCWVFDKTTEKEYFYCLATGTVANSWKRYDVEANTFTTLTQPPWATTNLSGGACCWDGADTIYAIAGEGTTGFAKYTISTNSWTSLTVAPANRAATFHNTNGVSTEGLSQLVYLPAAATGDTSDHILCFLAASGNLISRYRVTSNAWNNASALSFTNCPFTIDSTNTIVYDGRNKLYLIHFDTTGIVYVTTTTDAGFLTATPTWTSLGTVSALTEGGNSGGLYNQYVSKLRSSADVALTVKYWFLGDADGVAAVTKVNDQYHWIYIGKYLSVNAEPSGIAALGAPTAAGLGVTFTVDTTEGLGVDDYVLVWEHTTGTSERLKIQTIPGPTSFTANANFAHNAGATISADPAQVLVTGDSAHAVAPVSAYGYRTAYDADSYYLFPALSGLGGTDELSSLLADTKRGNIITAPYYIINPEVDGTFTNYETPTRELVGTLPLVYYSRQATGVNPEDTVVIRGKTYILFKPYQNKTSAGTRLHWIALGPID